MAGKDNKKKSMRAGTYGYSIRAVNWQAWLNVVLLFITLETAVLSIEKAHWISPQPSLTLTLVLSMLVTILLIGRRLPGAIKHLLVLLAGLLVILWQAQNLLPAPGLAARLAQTVSALQPWRFAGTAAAGTENILFALFLLLVTWVFGYLSLWFLKRRRNAWVGVTLGAVVILVNLSNLMDSYYIYLFCFTIAAVLFIAHTRLLRRPDPAGFTRRGWIYAGVALLCISVLAGSLARFTPELRIPDLETFIATRTLWKKNVEESSLNIFSSVPAKQAASVSSALREQDFGGEWHQGDNVNFIVDSPRPSYWRVHVYDLYTARGWENSPASDYLLEQKKLWDESISPSSPAALTYTVNARIKTDIMLMAGSFISADDPAVVQVSAGDVVAVSLPRVLRPGEQYTITSRFPSPSPAALAGSGVSYPRSVTDYYLQLPPDFPESVRELSRNITVNATTPYQKVLAINEYLAGIPYEGKIKAPPDGADPVEYFLFTQKSGFCLYYASAMSVMLRSVGVPSRLAVGYLPGEPGDKSGEYLLKDKDYHAWPEVYFEGYGWIDLEATPGGAGSGVTIETPWVSNEAIAGLPQWNVWETLPPPELADVPDNQVTPAAPRQTGPGSVTFFFADELRLALLVIFAGALVLLALAAPALVLRASFNRWLWRVDRDRLSSLMYDKLCNLAARIDLGPRPQQTPLEFAAVLAAEFPDRSADFFHIARSYVENKFGRRGRLGLFEEAELLKARCRAFDVLLKRLGLAGRLKRVRVDRSARLKDDAVGIVPDGTGRRPRLPAFG